MVVMYDTGRSGGNLLGQALYRQVEESSELCDFSIKIDDVEQMVHRCVLLTCPYFQALEETGLEEKQSGKVQLCVGTMDALQAVIKFLYLGRVDITLDNAEDLLLVSDYLQLTEMKVCCIQFLLDQHVEVENCVALHNTADKYVIEPLYDMTFEFMRNNIADVVNDEGSVALQYDSVLALLSSNTTSYVSYISAKDTFLFIMRWVETDMDSRLCHFSDLFVTCINMQRFEPEFYYSDVRNHMYVCTLPKCREAVEEFDSALKQGTMKFEPPFKDVYFVAGTRSDIYQPGLLRNTWMRKLFGYIAHDDSWIELSPLPMSVTSDVILASCNGCLYATDLITELSHLSRIRVVKYDPVLVTWSDVGYDVPYFERERGLRVLGFVSCDEELYVFTQSAHPFGPERVNIYRLKGDLRPYLSWVCELYVGSLYSSDVKCSVVQNRYICMVGSTPPSAYMIGQNSKTVFAYFDCETGQVIESSPRSYPGEDMDTSHHMNIVSNKNDKLVIVDVINNCQKVYSFETRCWEVEQNSDIESPLSSDKQLTDFASFVSGEEAYIFGGKSLETQRRVKVAYKLKLCAKCESVSAPPCGIVRTNTCMLTLPSYMLRCPVYCQHCRAIGSRDIADYVTECPPYRRDNYGDSYDDDPSTDVT